VRLASRTRKVRLLLALGVFGIVDFERKSFRDSVSSGDYNKEKGKR
jgi:hypothetical protein